MTTAAARAERPREARGDEIRAALWYAEHWRSPVFPADTGAKRPLISTGKDHLEGASRDPEQIRRWWMRWPDARVGLVTGQGGVLVIDVDVKHLDGYETLRDLEEKLGALPDTPRAQTASGGAHLYFRYPDEHDIKCSVSTLGPSIDIRARGGIVIAPPSPGYSWFLDAHPRDLALAELPPAWIEALVSAPSAPGDAADALPAEIHAGEGRNTKLTSLAGSLRRRGCTIGEILITLQAVNSNRCKPPLPDEELRKIGASVGRYASQERTRDATPAPGTVAELRNETEADIPHLRVINVAELLTAELRPRVCVLSPVFYTQSTNMLFSKRGVGKTHVAVGLAYAASVGGSFLRYRAERPHRTLFVDGELPAAVLRERFARLVDATDGEPPDPDYLKIITPDFQDRALPDLATRLGQQTVEEHLADIELMLLDNLSALCRSGIENDAESWLPIQEWALSLRRRDVVVLFVHHAGHAGHQRGTSKREDLLDTVIELRRPRDYDPSQGARFEVHLAKARGVHGPDAEPYEAQLVTDEHGRTTWTIRSIEDRTAERVAELVRDGLNQRDVAAELGISKSAVNRHVKKARERGLL